MKFGAGKVNARQYDGAGGVGLCSESVLIVRYILLESEKNKS